MNVNMNNKGEEIIVRLFMKKIQIAGCLIGITDELFDLSGNCFNEYLILTEEIPKIVLKKDNVNEKDYTFGYYRDICRRLINKDVMPFHGAAVKLLEKDEAYVFAGLSGAGKSTQARLWKKNLGMQALILNDDRPFIRFEKNQIIVCGSPWKGKHHIGENGEATLKAVCFVKKCEKNQIRRVLPDQAFPLLLRQCFPIREYAEKVIVFVERMSRTIPIWELSCTLSSEAFDVAYRAMVIDNGKKAE